MKSLLLLPLLFLIFSFEKAWAFETGVLEISPDHKVFYKHKEAKAGQPTLVIVNGLIYAIENWNEYFEEMVKEDVGVLQLAYSTQPESLKYLEQMKPYYSNVELSLWGYKQKGLETQTFVDETMAVIDSLGIKTFSVLSLSYGSIVAAELAAQQKDRIDNLLLIAPAVVTSGRYNPYGQSRHAYYSLLKAAGNTGADYYYDLEIYNTLSMVITPQKYSFDAVPFSNFFDGVYQMARSSKWFDLKDYSTVSLPNTFLFLASLEEAPLLEDQKKFWELMESNPAKKSMVFFEGSYHAIPGVAPKAAAEQTLLILNNKLSAKNSTVKVGTGNPVGTLKNSLIGTSQ